MQARVLLLADNLELAGFWAYALEQRGHRCRVEPMPRASGVAKAWGRFAPDLLVVDGSPDLPPACLRLIEGLRRADGRPPIFALAPANGHGSAPIPGPGRGFDDSLAKPFDIREFIARAEALLRRFYAPLEEVYDLGGVRMDLERHEVRARGRPVRLTAREFALLAVLLRKAGRVLSRPYLLQAAWGGEGRFTHRSVDMCVCRLRTKLGPAGGSIETVPQFGYRFVAPERRR